MTNNFKYNREQRYLYLTVFIMGIILILPGIRLFFQDTGWRWAYILLLSFAISFCLTPFCRWIACRFDILDMPDTRKSHAKATPLLGGAAVFVSFTAAIIINGIYSAKLWAILTGSALLFLMGLADDVKEVSAIIKLGMQVSATVMVMVCGILLHIIPEHLGMFSLAPNILLTLLWVIGITNAMNFFDGMDGVAAGLGAIISFFLGVVAFQTNQPFLGWIGVAMMGSCMGFLPYNFKIRGRACIFLGDAGSTVIGFILACLAVYGEWAQHNPVVAIVSPLLIFWILIFDMIYITADRIISGKVHNFRQWIEYVGKDHLHHRLADVLGSQKKSVLFIYLLAFCLGTSAVALRNADSPDALLLLIQAFFIVILITILERRGRSLAGKE